MLCLAVMPDSFAFSEFRSTVSTFQCIFATVRLKHISHKPCPHGRIILEDTPYWGRTLRGRRRNVLYICSATRHRLEA